MTKEERAEEVAMNVVRAFDAVGPKQASLEIIAYADEIRRECADNGVKYAMTIMPFDKMERDELRAAIIGKEDEK